MNNPPLIQVEAVTRDYPMGKRVVPVLKGLTFEIQQGEFVALRGASGTGKSTLLHLLGGLDVPNSGKIRFDGQDLTTKSGNQLSQFRNGKVGFIFQFYHLFPELDALENVALPARISRHSSGDVEARARQLLERVGLGHRIDHLPAELSGGEQQRVSIARALINDPILILADEPTGNLDFQNGDAIMDLLCALWQERKTTLVIATHDLKVANRAPRVIELLDGRIAPL